MRTPIFFLLLALIIACNSPNSIGLDIPEDELKTGVGNTLVLPLQTVYRGPQPTFKDSVRLFNNFVAGELNDPLFGHTKASFYSQLFILELLDDDQTLSFSSVDSVILSLKYDEANSMGAFRENAFNIRVFRLDEDLDRSQSYLSNATFSFLPTPIGEKLNVVPNLDSSFTLELFDGDSTSSPSLLDPHIRIPLDLSLGEEILSYDNAVFESQTRFLENFKGIYIEAESENSMLSFDINDFQVSNMTIFYTNDQGFQDEFFFSFSTSGVSVPHYEHAFENGLVNDYFDNDSLLFAQSLLGPEIAVDLSVLDTVDGELSYAQLELYSAYDLDGMDERLFPFPNFIGAVEDNEDQGYPVIEDYFADLSSNNYTFNSLDEFRIEDGQLIQRYTFFLTFQVRDYLNGDAESVFWLTPRDNISFPSRGLLTTSPERIAFFGNGHPKYAPKFTYGVIKD